MISAGDEQLFRFVETAEEAWEVLADALRLRPAAHDHRRPADDI
jgi:hypothetical protein